MAESATLGDIKFYYDFPAPADVKVVGTTLFRDPGFETAVLISLFSDARASSDDPLPDNNDTRRGWWGSAVTGTEVGSKLWLFDRSNINNAMMAQQAQYIEQALAWMITDGIASKITATATRSDTRTTQINYSVSIQSPTKGTIFFQFFYNWKSQIFGGI